MYTSVRNTDSELRELSDEHSIAAVHTVHREVLEYFPNASMALPSSGNADGLAAKLAWQTLSGVAMGWANDGVPDDASRLYNGTGTIDWLVRPAGGREREWLQRLAALRRGAGSYLVHGYRARDLLHHNAATGEPGDMLVCTSTLD